MPDEGVTVDEVMAATRTVLKRARTEEVQIGPDSRFDSLGVESMQMIEILIALEDATGAVISDTELARIETISDLASCRVTRLREAGTIRRDR